MPSSSNQGASSSHDQDGSNKQAINDEYNFFDDEFDPDDTAAADLLAGLDDNSLASAIQTVIDYIEQKREDYDANVSSS